MKDFRIVSKGSHKAIEFVGGGKIPTALEGLFTSQADAQAAIDLHLQKVEDMANEGASTRKRRAKETA